MVGQFGEMRKKEKTKLLLAEAAALIYLRVSLSLSLSRDESPCVAQAKLLTSATSATVLR